MLLQKVDLNTDYCENILDIHNSHYEYKWFCLFSLVLISLIPTFDIHYSNYGYPKIQPIY